MSTKAKASKSANPAYPDADPTAPGGMSQKALAMELRDKHGWTPAQVREAFPNGLKDWAKMIDAVIEERKAAEDAQRQQIMAEHEGDSWGEVEEALVDAGLDPDDDEFEESLLDWHAAHPFEDAPLPDMPDEDDIDPDAMMAALRTAREADEAAQPTQRGLLIKDPTGEGTLDYIFDGHAGAGPSGSERWMHCTASLGASRAFLETLTPRQQETFAIANLAARQGTTAHAAAEVEARMVLGEVDQSEVDLTLLELSIEPDEAGEAYDDEMAEYITEYVDLVKSYAQDRGDDHVLIEQVVEAAVPLTGMHEGEVYAIRGSGDCIVLPTSEDSSLVVADLKYGNGIDVDVDENPQVRIYALGALGLLVNDDGELITDVEDVTYHIVQPRLGGIKTWSEPLADLLQWRDEVLAPRLTAALFGADEGATFAPSETACQFCPARGGCAALAETRLTQAANLFDVIVEAEFVDGPGAFPETGQLTNDRLGELLTQIAGLTDIHKSLKEETERRLFRGEQVAGWQLVNYTPPRKWKDDASERLPREDNPDLWCEPKMVSPTQAEKILGKDVYPQIAELVDVPDKRPVVAKVGDRRKPWTGRPPEAMFDDEGEES